MLPPVAAYLLASCVPGHVQAAATARKPNFVLIVADYLGYGDIQPFGSKLNRTPNLDSLCKSGVKLTDFYAAPLCSASRAQIMTGCYAKRVGIPDVMFPVRRTGLAASEETLPQILKGLGYATMCIGKWHFGDQPPFLPTSKGFDHYFGLPYSNNMDGSEGKQNPKNPMPPLPLLRDSTVIEAPAVQDTLTRRYTDEAVAFIDGNKDKPFFLYMPQTAVHHPLHPGEGFRGKSKNGDYGDWVEEVDWSVGKVLEALRNNGLEENTLVVFTSDNGATNSGSNAPFHGLKGTTWEGGMRVPAIASWPGKIPPGSSSRAVAGLIDILPTFAALAGGKPSGKTKIDGVDIWPVLCGREKSAARDGLYYFLWHRLEAVRSGDWKLVMSPQKDACDSAPGDDGTGPRSAKNKQAKSKAEVFASREKPRLYNLADDPAETTDLAERRPEVVARLDALVARMDADLGIESDKKRNPRPGVRKPDEVSSPQPLMLAAGSATPSTNP
jgi:arylsulfatase A-like enzyme